MAISQRLPIVLSKAQVLYMAEVVKEHDFDHQVIYATRYGDGDHDILVGNDPQFGSGDGVWVDKEGNEELSPHG